MKSFLKIAVGVAALAFVQPASASTTFTITGSTAFRGGLFDTIVALMGGTPASNIATCKITTTASGTNGTTAAGRSAINAANTVTFVGSITGVNGGNPITIFCSLSGSASGLISIFNSSVLTYAPATATTAGYNNIAFGATGTTAPGAAQFSMSDVYQNSVTSTKVTGLTETTVAVIPFVFVANKGSTLTNFTAQNARTLLNNGTLPQSFLTGNPADTNNVYATGRDGGSGTRVAVLSETKYGVATSVQQYFAVTSGTTGSGSITSLQVWPTSGTPNFDPLVAGNGGYGSGGTIASLMGFTGGSVNILDATGATTTTGDTNVAVVGYVGAGDAATAVGNGGVRLSYDGNVYDGSSTAQDSVRNGGYTLWSYEHLSYKGTPVGDELALINKIKLNIAPNLSVNGIDLTTMVASRTGDGAVVGP